MIGALSLAGCGGSDEPEPEAAAAPRSDAALGKRLFTEKECVGCHTLSVLANESPRGPNLDRLPEYARRAGEPLEAFIRESIVDPDAYVEQGFAAGRMPPNFGELPMAQIDALVRFLVESTG